jgi:tRNA pseudouridine38-40 synthase
MEDNNLVFTVEANRFLRGMVRALVATMLKVSRGTISLQQLREIIESKNCGNADFSAPAKGLFLQQVKYPYKLTAVQ